MKARIITVLAVAGAAVAFGQANKADTASVEKALMAMEQEWSQIGLNKANMEKDVQKLDRILADDWVGVDFQGTVNNKTAVLNNLKSGAATTQSIELGPMKVRVFGDTAVVTGSDTEKSTYKGKDSSGKYMWTDVFVNRNGKWQAVSSETTKVQQ